MLKSLYTLSQKYVNKKVVVFGVNRSSIVLFTKLSINYQVNVSLFWDADNRFVGQYLVNRRIVSTDELRGIKDFIVIIPKAISKDEVLQSAMSDIDVFYIDEVLSLNEELKEMEIYIYGIGHRGEIIYDELQEQGIAVTGVCVTDKGKVEKWCGHDVISIGQIDRHENCAVIIATDIKRSQNEMLEQLEKFNSIQKYILYFMHEGIISEGNFFQVINFALLKRKEIWFYCSDNENILYLNDILKRYHINITKTICNEGIFDLEYENINNISVIVAENDCARMEWACNTLDSMGFGLEKWDYTATGSYTFTSALNRVIKKDVLIGKSTYENEKYPGYVVYGNDKSAKVRMMILGGSTSTDHIYRTTSWVRFLYEKLLAAGYDVVIFNGAVCAHGIVDEFLHMLRDIEPLKPDYVISFSGVNDTYRKQTKNLFNTRHAEDMISVDGDYISGIESNETLYDFWCRISMLIHITAKQYGAKAYSFLQPMAMANEKLDLIEIGMYDYTEHTKYVKDFRKRASEEKDIFYENLMSMFETNKNVYIDHCHYSTRANEIIAERVFKSIEQDIK